MKKIFYWAVIQAEEKSSGINRKISGQIKAFRKIGYEVWYPVFYDGWLMITDGTQEKKIKKIKTGIFIQRNSIKRIIIRMYAARFLAGYLLNSRIRFDYMYVRYPLTDFGFLRLLKAFRKMKTRIAVEIPTYPYFGERKGKPILNKMLFYLDLMLHHRLKKYVDLMVVSSDTKEKVFGIETLRIDNGIDLDEVKPVTHKNIDGMIHIISVSSMARWHGLDRFIEGINLNVETVKQNKIITDLIGDGLECSRLKKLVKEELKDYVIFHGPKFGDDLEKLYEIADIGISTLALHRAGIKSASVLKTREYMAKGIPFMLGYIEEEFPCSGLEYVHQVSASDDPIDIVELLNFYSQVNGRENNRIRNTMRMHAEEHLAWDFHMGSVIKKLESIS